MIFLLPLFKIKAHEMSYKNLRAVYTSSDVNFYSEFYVTKKK
jgi:hypothetical protein